MGQATDTPPVSPTPTTSTQRRHGRSGYLVRFAAIAIIETSRAGTDNTSELLSPLYDGCDEPEIVPYRFTQICPMSADVRHAESLPWPRQ